MWTASRARITNTSALRTALYLVLIGQLAACGHSPAPSNTYDDVDETDALTRLESTFDDTTSLPPAIVPSDWPTAPRGASSPADWEALYRDALDRLAGGHADQANDLVYQLQELTTGPAPAGADTLYLEHRRSIRRRLTLIAGLAAEMRAYSGSPTAADSLLTAEYLALEGIGFPDTLVPATGTSLPPLQADLLKVNHERVDRWLTYFTGRGQRQYQLWLDRKIQVERRVGGILREEGVPDELIYVAMIESGFSTRARSSVGAVGPWQFMAPTARAYGLQVNWWVDDRRDLTRSTRAAARYLRALHDQFGDWALVLAAYNSGGSRVRRQLRERGHDNFWDYSLPSQTIEYVPKFIAAARIGADPEAYGFTYNSAEPVLIETLEIQDATDLGLIATCAGLDEATVFELNPALLRRATPPGIDRYRVTLPLGTADVAARTLRKIPATKRLTWRKHGVSRGETLSHIASQWGTSVRSIQEANSLGKGTLIRPGDQLLIPMPRELADLARTRAEKAGRYVPPDGSERVTYKVKPGDTLGGIARRLGVSVRHLKKVNGIKNANKLRAGQTIAAYRDPRRS